MDIKPLDVKVKKALMNNGSMLDVISFDQYASNTELYSSHTVGIMEEVNKISKSVNDIVNKLQYNCSIIDEEIQNIRKEYEELVMCNY